MTTEELIELALRNNLDTLLLLRDYRGKWFESLSRDHLASALNVARCVHLSEIQRTEQEVQRFERAAAEARLKLESLRKSIEAAQGVLGAEDNGT